uniref:Uncharacterized protein n=1 Tax=Ditylenchus dipsaci TaxID=166011 RepID=A0A915EK46_9BILA
MKPSSSISSARVNVSQIIFTVRGLASHVLSVKLSQKSKNNNSPVCIEVVCYERDQEAKICGFFELIVLGKKAQLKSEDAQDQLCQESGQTTD